MDESNTQLKQNKPMGLFVAVGSLFLVIAVVVLIYSNKNTPRQTQQSSDHRQESNQISPAVSATGVKTVNDGGTKATGTDEKTFTIEGGNFYFKPNELRVKKGDNVKITFTNSGGIHDFVIDEFNVQSEKISGGKTAVVTFTPDKTGTFEFYCSIGNHRQMGMMGTMIVE